MKLYVWNAPYRVKYGGSCLYVVADDEESARVLAKSVYISRSGYTPNADDVRLGLDVSGPPTRIIECPGGECYHWEE